MSSIITIQQTPTVHGEQFSTAFEEDAPRHIMMPSLSEETTGNASLGSDDPDASDGEHEPWAIRISPPIGNESELDVTVSPFVSFPTGNHSSSSSREGGDEDEGPATASEREEDDVRTPSGNDIFSITEEAEINAARKSSLEMLQGNRPAAPSTGLAPSFAAGKGSASRSPKKKGRRKSRVPEGFIILKEERATIFHDFLKFVYPQWVFAIFAGRLLLQPDKFEFLAWSVPSHGRTSRDL
jgi:hypothetical protein